MLADGFMFELFMKYSLIIFMNNCKVFNNALIAVCEQSFISSKTAFRQSLYVTVITIPTLPASPQVRFLLISLFNFIRMCSHSGYIVVFLSDEGPMLETLDYTILYPYWQYTDLFIFRFVYINTMFYMFKRVGLSHEEL